MSANKDKPLIFSLVFNLFKSFKNRRKLQLLLLFILILVSSFAEVLSIGAVLPFIAMLTSPEKLFYHSFFKSFVKAFQIHSPNEIILPLTVVFVVVVIIAGFFRLLFGWLSSRLTSACGSELSSEVFKRVLYQPYIEHITKNSSEIINTLTHKVDGVVFGVILTFFTLVNSIILVISVVATLLLIQPQIAIYSMLIFGFSYLVIAWLVRKRLIRNSLNIVNNQAKTIKIVQESLGGVRDMILDGNQELYTKYYKDADFTLRRSSTINNYISLFPKYTMETLGMVVIAILAFYLTKQAGSIQKVLPILGAIGVGSQRILPAIQQIYNSWVSISGNYHQLTDVLASLSYPIPKLKRDIPPLEFNQSIQLRNLTFRYNDHGPVILDKINMFVSKGDRIGFIGSTGSGKSTLLDIIMGLLYSCEGSIIVDNITLTDESLRAWQNNIAHVPQFIFLADATIAENIAFGIPKEQIDYDKVKEVASIAKVSDFVENYPTSYETIVGERGINLSGGQRQRIGIARALYKNASVLILDEATSALDNHTEREVMNGIMSLNRNLTLLIIAHRLSSLQDCDFIFEVVNGNVKKHELSEIL
jgi:ATP-binding cassette subfamily B protein